MLEPVPLSSSEKFGVWIEDVDSGDEIKEYDLRYISKELVSCYVVSKNEQRFRVCAKVDKTERTWAMDVYIDGQWVRGSLFGMWDRSGTWRTDKFARVAEIDAGEGQIIPLRFGKTQTAGIHPRVSV